MRKTSLLSLFIDDVAPSNSPYAGVTGTLSSLFIIHFLFDLNISSLMVNK